MMETIMEATMDNVMENESLVKELVYELRQKPRVDLPRGLFTACTPKDTSPNGWRQVFVPLRDSMTNADDKLCYDHILRVIDLVEECGGMKIVIIRQIERGMGGRYYNTLVFDDFVFPNGQYASARFWRELCKVS